MKTFEIIINGDSHYFKTNATIEQIQQAVDFVKMGAEPTLDKLLVALRTLGAKATPINVEPVDVFEL